MKCLVCAVPKMKLEEAYHLGTTLSSMKLDTGAASPPSLFVGVSSSLLQPSLVTGEVVLFSGMSDASLSDGSVAATSTSYVRASSLLQLSAVAGEMTVPAYVLSDGIFNNDSSTNHMVLPPTIT